MSAPSYQQAAQAVRRVHAVRVFPMDGGGGDVAYCVEDRQSWPCATIAALDDLEDQAEQFDRESAEADARRDEEPF